MRRLLLMLAVAAVMAAMVVTAGPAQAKIVGGVNTVGVGNSVGSGSGTGNINNSFGVVQVGGSSGDIEGDGISIGS
jgi:hypothetical protein